MLCLHLTGSKDPCHAKDTIGTKDNNTQAMCSYESSVFSIFGLG